MAVIIVASVIYLAVLVVVAQSIAFFIKFQRRRNYKRPIMITILDEGGKVLGRERVVLSQ